MLVFYRSDRAKTVITEGFQDEYSIQAQGSDEVGCVFSTDPFDESIRAKGSIVLFLDMPRTVFLQYVKSSLNPVAKTALIPAQVANQYGPAKLLTYKSAVLLARLIKAKRNFTNYTESVTHLSPLTAHLPDENLEGGLYCGSGSTAG